MRVVESEIGLLLVAVLALGVEMGLGLVGSSVSILILISICTGDTAVKGAGERIGLSLSLALLSSNLTKHKALMLGSSRWLVVPN